MSNYDWEGFLQKWNKALIESETFAQYLKYSDFVIKSFNDASVRRIKDLDPQIKVGLLLGKVTGKFPLLSILAQFFPEYRSFKTGADFVAPHFQMLRFGFLWRMKLVKKGVYVWTVNDERRLFKLMRSKYISAIVTDKPELAMKILATKLSASSALHTSRQRNNLS